MTRAAGVALLAAALGGAGCISERAGCVADGAETPRAGSFREAVAAMGNPSATRTLPDGGTEAVWTGAETRGGAFTAGVFGVRLVRLGNVRTRVWLWRMRFDAAGRRVGEAEPGENRSPRWGTVPF